MVFKNMVLIIYKPKRDDVVGGWRKLHNEELCNLYSLPNIIKTVKSRRIIWSGHVACMRETWNAYRVLLVKPEGK
jgi:hypothetical protein